MQEDTSLAGLGESAEIAGSNPSPDAKDDERLAAAWLETGGEKLPIRGDCSIGRSPKNKIVIDSQRVSRRHAIINVQDIGQFWLIDLGSSNGTYLNGRRIHNPVRLSNQDQLVIGDQVFIFNQPHEITDSYSSTLAQRTLAQVQEVPCWLIVADIENFTPLSHSMKSDQLAELIGGWIANCKQAIEKHHGTIDKYLGDGFFAYWRANGDAAKNIAAALSDLKEIQRNVNPPFRIAVHHGAVSAGGMPSMGEESLMGREVNFVFRMEKLAGVLGVPILLSDSARARLQSFSECKSCGAHDLKGFEGQHQFFCC
jgi:adenylate cyclase